MMAFDVVFPELARREALALALAGQDGKPVATFLFREFYCNDPGCDCRRVVLHVHWVERKLVAASIGYGFEPALPPFEDEPQVMLDPINPQTDASEHILEMFEDALARDPSVRARFVAHYEAWKRVVDDPAHPDHGKVRSAEHDDPSFKPAYRPRPSAYPDQPCPCTSGRKYKNCCGRAAQPAKPSAARARGSAGRRQAPSAPRR